MLKFLSSVFKNVGKGGEVHNAVLKIGRASCRERV